METDTDTASETDTETDKETYTKAETENDNGTEIDNRTETKKCQFFWNKFMFDDQRFIPVSIICTADYCFRS